MAESLFMQNFRKLQQFEENTQQKTNALTNPFGVELLDNLYKETARNADAAGSKNPLGDAYKAVTNFRNTARISDTLGAEDPLGTALKRLNEEMTQNAYRYSTQSITDYAGYKKIYDRMGFLSKKAWGDANRNRVLEKALEGYVAPLGEEAEFWQNLPGYAQTAMTKGVQALPENVQDRYLDFSGTDEWLDITGGAYRWEDLTPEQQKGIAAYGENMLGETAVQRQRLVEDEAIAKYLDANPTMKWASENTSEIKDYLDFYTHFDEYTAKAKAEGYQALPENIQGAYLDYANSEYGIEESNPNYAAEMAAQYQAASEIYQPYAPTAYQQYLEQQMRKTPEGAQAWLDEAMGTEDEQPARDNLYFVEKGTEYGKIPLAADFADKSKAQEVKRVLFTGKDTEIYAYINDQGTVRKEIDILSSSRGAPNVYDKYKYMSPDEVGIYNYLHAQEGGEKLADEYLEYLTYDLDARKNKADAQKAYEFAGRNGWTATAASILSVPTSLMRGVGYLDVLWQNIFGGDKPVNTERAAGWGIATDSTRQGVMDSVDWNIKIGDRDWDAFDFIYGAGMSTADSLASSAFGPAGVLMLGSGAAESTMREALDNGANNGQALTMGFWAGAFESIFEEISLSKFLKTAKGADLKGVKAILKELGIQGLTNASEEFNTSVANMLLEMAVMGEKGQYAQKYEYYRSMGLTEKEANAMVAKDMAWQLGQDTLAGLVQGTGMGTVAVASNKANQNSGTKKAGASIIALDAQTNLKNLAGSFQEGSEARKLAEEYNPETATAKQTGRLFREIVKELPKSMRTTVTDNFAQHVIQTLQEKGESENVGEVAVGLAKVISGQELSESEFQAVAKSEYGIEVMQELAGATEAKKQQKLVELTKQKLAPELKGDTAKEESPEAEQNLQIDADGEVTMVNPEGNRVAVEDAGLNADETIIIQGTAQLGDAGSNAAMEAWNAEPKEQGTARRTEAEAFARGFKRVYQAAMNGETEAAVMASPHVSGLSESARKAAWQAGAAALAEAQAKQTKANAERAKADGFRTTQEAGEEAGVSYAGVTKKISGLAKKQLQLIDSWAKELGLQVHVFDSLNGGKANGKLTKGSNVISLALDAEGGLLTRTVSHESFHFVEAWNADAAKKLQDFVVKTLQGKEGYDLQAEIQAKIKQYDENGVKLTEQEAIREIVADSVLDIIGTEENVRKLLQQDKNLAAKINDVLKTIMAKLRAMMQKLGWQSAETAALKDDLDYIENIQQMMADALKTASQNYANAQYKASELAKQDSAVQEYITDMKKSTSHDDAQAALNGMVSDMFMRAEKGWLAEHPDADLDESLQKFADALKTYKRGEMALENALKQAGFHAQPREMNTALSYAGTQLLQAEARGQGSDVQYSQKSMAKNGIEKGMSDEDRYWILRDSVIPLGSDVDATKKISRNEVERINGMNYRNAEESIKGIAESIGLVKGISEEMRLTNNQMTAVVFFSNRGIRESVRNQQKNYGLLAAAMPVLKDTYKNAVPIMEQDDRYRYTVKEDTELESMAYLLGAFKYDGEVYPVVFEVKKNKTPDGGLYVVTTIQNKKEDGPIMGAPSSSASTDASSEISIPDIVKNINPENENILSKFPAQMLNPEQRKAKIRGLEQRGRHLLEKAKRNPEGDNAANLTVERIDRMIRDYGSSTNPNYSRAYMTYINPVDFINLTTTNAERIYAESRTLIASEMREENQTPFLRYDQETGEITGHEGRHRMAALDASGVKKTAILMIPDGEKGRSNRQPLASLQVTGQEFGQGKAPGTAELTDLVPVNESHREELIEKFSESENWFQYSLKKTDIAKSVEEDAALFTQVKSDSDIADAVGIHRRLYYTLRRGDSYTQEGANIPPQEDGAWEKRLDKVMNQLIEETGSKYGKIKLKKKLKALYTAMDTNGADTGEMMVYAREIAMALLEEAPGVVNEMDEGTKEILQVLKTNAFYLTDDMKSEIRATQGSVADYRRKNFGKMKIRAKAGAMSSLADVWEETLNPLRPDVFTLDATEADMPIILDAFLETANEKTYSSFFEGNLDQYATDMALSIILEYYDLPGMAHQSQRLRDELQEKQQEIRTNYKQKYENRMKASRERKEATEDRQKMRKKIIKMVRSMNSRLLTNSDTKHIPQELKGAVSAMIRPFLDETGVFTGPELRAILQQYSLLAEGGKNQDIEAAYAYDPDIQAKIDQATQTMAGRRLSQLTLEELTDLRDIVGNLNKIIFEQNDIQVKGRKMTLWELGTRALGEQKMKKTLGAKMEKVMNTLYINMTPIYFFKQLGGVFVDLWDEVRSGQTRYIFNVKKAKAFITEQIKKYNVNQWYHPKENLKFRTEEGDDIELTKGQAMYLYATWKRELSNKLQDAAHLRIGGFVYARNDANGKLKVDTAHPHAIAQADMELIMGYLGKQAMQFVDETVRYLSEDMAALGNETSMERYGYEKFGESYYFPYKVSSDYTETNLAKNQNETPSSLFAWGASKKTVSKANKPVVLGDFMETWANHVNEMCVYNGFAAAVDNLNRVYNFVTPSQVTRDADGNIIKKQRTESLRAEIARAHGNGAAKYLADITKAIAGGQIGRSEDTAFMQKMVSKFRKNAVVLSASVAIQQPSAIMRAMAHINPKYFVGTPRIIPGKSYQELLKYSGTANVKAMGKFDVGMGQSAKQWILDDLSSESKLKDAAGKVDNAMGKAPEWMDQLTWANLWEAVKREQKAKNPMMNPASEEFLQQCGKRFDEVVDLTQVYDSVLSRSKIMRSNDGWAQMVTSFMAEPTLTTNMLQDAILNFKENKSTRNHLTVKRAAAVYASSVFFNALLQSLVTAARNDDEEKTYLEKYLAEFTENFMDGINPIGNIPILQDILSIFDGYDVERADMALIADLKDALDIVMDEEKSMQEKILAASKALGALFGIPVKNAIREVESIDNLYQDLTKKFWKTSMVDVKYSILEALPFTDLDSKRTAPYYERMLNALKDGDMEEYEELKSYVTGTMGKDEKTVQSGVQYALRDAMLDGKFTSEEAQKYLQKHWGLDKDDAYFKVDEWLETEEHKGEEDFDYSRYGDVYEAVKAGQSITEASKELLANGYTEKDIKGAVQSQIGRWYKDGEMSRSEAEKLLGKYTDKDDDDIFWQMDEWDYAKKNGSSEGYSKYNEVYAAVKAGKSITESSRKLLAHGYDEKDIKSAVQSQIGDWYIDGTMSKSEAEKRLAQYTDKDADGIYWQMRRWTYTKQNGTSEGYGVYNSFYQAVETGVNLKSAIREYTSHGYEAKSLAGQITEKYKDQYISLYRTNKTAAANLKARLLTAYAALGYDRNKKAKDIDKWLTQK